MTILVLGGTGTVGSEVVRGLLDVGASVRVLTRFPEKADQLPAGATGIIGDCTDPTTLDGVFGDVDRLFLLNGVTATELQEGLVALNEAQRAGVDRVVYLSVHDVEKGPHIPHFASKIAIEAAIKASGIDYTILRPNNFYQNDTWVMDAIRSHGVYPQPIGEKGLSRVDARDIAEAAVRALTQNGYEKRTYALVGPEVLTGPDCARAYATALDRDVHYAGNDLDAWSAQVSETLPAWMVYDFRLMYTMFQQEGLVATDAQLEETKAILGGPPRRFADFVHEAVKGIRPAPAA